MSVERKTPKLLDEFLAEYESELDASALDVLTAVDRASSDAAPSSLRARLLASTHAAHRFDDFEARIAELADIDDATVRALLLRLDDPRPDAWEPSFVDGINLVNFEGGPRVTPAITGFVRIQPGVTFPHHQHHGDEVVLVLQGSCVMSDGLVCKPGDELRMAAGTEHSFRIPEDAVPFIYLAVVRTGIQIGDQFIGPDDTRL